MLLLLSSGPHLFDLPRCWQEVKVCLPAIGDPALDATELPALVVVAEQALVLLAQLAPAFAFDLSKGEDVGAWHPYR
jgi:hypothetical protein